MLGQPASWHTVCRPSGFTRPLSSVYSGPILARVLIHSGLRSIGVCALRTSRRSSLRPSGAIVTAARLRCDGRSRAAVSTDVSLSAAWTSGSSPSPSRGRPTTTCSGSRGRPRSCGFDAFFRSDHYLAMGDGGPARPDRRVVTLAGLARETSRIRLGTLVTSATFRLPGPLAITVAQVDAMSGGRVELGLGTGWFEAEHAAYGIPFPPLGERFDRLERAARDHHRAVGDAAGRAFTRSPARTTRRRLARAAQAGAAPRPPVIVGGYGPRRTPGWPPGTPTSSTCRSRPSTTVAAQYEPGRRGLRRTVGPRPAGRCVHSAAQTVCCRAATTPRSARRADGDRPRRRRAAAAIGLAGTAGARSSTGSGVRRATGATRIYLQVLDLADLDHLELIAAEVAPQLG